MALNYFSQFAPSLYFGVPLTGPALIFPRIAMIRPARPKWINNRLFNMQRLFLIKLAQSLFGSLKTPTRKWTALLIALATYITLMNTLGLLPYTFTPTTQLSISLSLAVPLWLTAVVLGLRHQPAATLAHFLPQGTPMILTPMLVIIETISLLIRPLALGVRLTANLTAGHLLIQLISTASATLLPTTPTLAILTFALLILLTILEIAVALIQAYVFALLLALYLDETA